MSKNAVFKPCPFCGGEAEITNALGEWWVSCTECGEASASASREGARSHWNTRQNKWINASKRTPGTTRDVLLRLHWPIDKVKQHVGFFYENTGWWIHSHPCAVLLDDSYVEPERVQWMEIPR